MRVSVNRRRVSALNAGQNDMGYPFYLSVYFIPSVEVGGFGANC